MLQDYRVAKVTPGASMKINPKLTSVGAPAVKDYRTLESHSDEFILRILQDRGVKLEPCAFREENSNQTCGEYGIYTKDEFPPPPTSRSNYPICYCPEHRELLKSEDHRGWCTQNVIVPNGDTVRCQHTGAFSWEHKRYLCKEHLTPMTKDIPRAT